MKLPIDVPTIQALLPHRYPFLLLDHAVDQQERVAVRQQRVDGGDVDRQFH